MSINLKPSMVMSMVVKMAGCNKYDVNPGRIDDIPAHSVKYTDIARDNEDDKTPKLSVQLMNIALRMMFGGLMLVQ